MSTPPTLADLTSATLDPTMLAALFADIAACGEDVEVLAKAAPAAYAGAGRLDLATAHALLSSGAVRGVQVRYRYQGEEWWDTLMAAPGGVRIVRVKQDFSA